MTHDADPDTDWEAAYAGDVPDTPEHYDLVVSTYVLPSRGPDRIHALTVARDAVAQAGTALIAELEA